MKFCLTLFIQLVIITFFLGSKKRDLSDKSGNGEDSKKVKEKRQFKFSARQSFFRWFKLSGISKITCKLYKKYRERSKEAYEEAKESQIKVTESLEFMSAQFDDLEKEIKKKDGKINQLEKTNENLVEKQTIWSSTHDKIVWFYMVSMKATTRTQIKS